MTIQLARRMADLQASEIREILKLTSQPGVISFAGGLPAQELFPVEAMAAAAVDVLHSEGPQALQYSTTEGCPALRDAIATRMNRFRGTQVGSDQVLVTSGSQQGLDLSGKVLLDEGDAVLCESPTYLGALQALKVFQPEFVEVPTDADGMCIAALERRLAASPVKLIYVVPDFQNPSGRQWSLARRREFMGVVRRRGVVVIEDCPYAELQFDGGGLPSLKSLDRDGQVVFLGTFSKILCPGVRIAWLAGDASLVRKYVLVKQGTDLHTSTLAQLQVARFLEQNDLDAHINRLRATYRDRCAVMLEAMDRLFPAGVSYTRPGGGLFLWVELPEQLNARDLLARCLEAKVAFVPGGAFYPNGGHENTLRLNFSAMQPETIVTGIERMAVALQELMAVDTVRSA